MATRTTTKKAELKTSTAKPATGKEAPAKKTVTKKVTEIGGATTLTVITGGVAAPLVFGVGCAEGIGKT